MSRFKEKECSRCSKMFTPAGPAGLYCESCQAIRAEEVKVQEREHNREAYRKKEEAKGRILGRGQGSSNRVGADHPQYKNGMGILARMRKIVKEHYRFCQNCGCDLQEVGPTMWCTHHKDRNRKHNHFDNLILLCKRCHQIEHDCHSHFNQEGATTIP